MDEIERVKIEIENTERSLSKKMVALEARSRTLLSPQHYIQQHPLLAAGICFGLGLVLGSSKRGIRGTLEPLATTAANCLLTELQRQRSE